MSTHNSSPVKHPFLSDEWIEAARLLRAEFADQIPPAPVETKINVIVTDIPFSDSDRHGHIDTTTGAVIIDEGHLDDAALLLKVDYATAMIAFVGQDQAAMMRAFFEGKIYVEGDASQLMALQSTQVGPEAIEMYKRLDAITEAA